MILLAGEAARLEPKALPLKKGFCAGKTVGSPGGRRAGGGEKSDGIATLEQRGNQ